jgi:hypothetical protein
MIKPLLVAIAMLSGTAAAQCLAGCLVCAPDNTCRFCDPTKGFYLNATACNATAKDNCVLVADGGDCVACKPAGYLLDPTTKNCVALAANQTVASCAVHSAASTCAVCSTGYYPTNSSFCDAVTAPIPDCAAQNSNTTCSACKPGFALNSTATGCVSVAQPNCALSSQAKCARCKGNFNLNSAFGLGQVSQRLFSAGFARGLLQAVLSPGLGTFALPVCYGVDRCVEYSPTDGGCLRCQSGYSFNSSAGACNSNPLPRVVDFCDVYRTSTTCATCKTGYLLASPTSCVPLLSFPNCLAYNLSAPATQCVTCANFTFIDSNGGCTNRTAWNLTNCLNYSQTSDVCTTCATDFVLTTDGRACKSKISNCLAYAASTAADASLLCSQCAVGYYLASNKLSCVTGAIANCAEFVDYTGACSKCRNGYYASNGGCVAATGIAGCLTFSQTQDLKCDTCQANFAKFTVQQGCTLVTPINNCKTYSAPTVCSLCNDGFGLGAGGLTCNALTTANCVAYFGTTCTKCLDGFTFSSGACVAATDDQKVNCDITRMFGTFSSDAASPRGCRQCVQGANPVVYTLALLCLPQTILVTANGGAALDANCLGWQLTSGTYQCIKCADNFRLQGTACVASCSGGTPSKFSVRLPTTTTTGMYSASLDFRLNTCEAEAFANCDTTTPLYNQASNTPAYGCAQCNSGFLAYVDFAAADTLKPTAVRRTQVTPKLNSCRTTPASIIGTAANTAMTDCAYYFLDATTTKNACLGCVAGKTGKVIYGIPLCTRYSSSTCSLCIVGYHPAADRLSCVANTAITNCVRYDASTTTTSCLSCTLTAAYIQVASSVGTCVTRTYTSADCATYHVSSDTCIACVSGRVLVAGKCYTPLTNCLNHGSLGTSPFYQCIACDPTASYITAGAQQTCTAVTTIADCTLYSQTEPNVCLKCGNSKLLSNNVCSTAITSVDATKGLLYSASPATCWDTARMFTVTKKCAAPTTITDCAQYTAVDKCGKCVTGKYLKSLTTAPICDTIPASVNCAEYVPVDVNNDGVITAADQTSGAFTYTCNKCNTGYVYRNASSVATCEAKSFLTITNCGTSANDGTGRYDTVNCKACSSGFVPFSFDGLRMCVDTASFFTAGTNPIESVTNCALYKVTIVSNVPTYRCVACNAGFGLETVSGALACSATCTASGDFVARYTYEFKSGDTAGNYRIKDRNVCIALGSQTPAIPTGCKYVVPQFNLPTGTPSVLYVCAQCSSGTTPITSLNPAADNIFTSANLFSPINPAASGTYTLLSPFKPFNEIKECVTTSTADFGTGVTGQVDANCEQYGKIASGVYACNRCNNGFSAVIAHTGNTNLAALEACAADSDAAAAPFPVTGMQNDPRILKTWGSLRGIFSYTACATATKTPTAFLGLKATSPYNVLGWVSWSKIDATQTSVPTAPASLNDYSTAATTPKRTRTSSASTTPARPTRTST